MKLNTFIKITFLFLALLFIQIILSFFFVKVIGIKAEVIVQLCIDLGFLITSIVGVVLWEIDVKSLFKKIKFKNIIILCIISILIHLLYPIFNVINLIKSTLVNKIGIIEPLSSTNFFNQNTSFLNIYMALKLLVIMPFLEEILYRGIFLNKLQEKYSPFIAIVISSLFFGLGHMELEQSIATFFSGLILGYIYLKSANLSTVILVHFFINLCTFFTKLEYINPIRANEFIYYYILILLLLFLLKKIKFTTLKTLIKIDVKKTQQIIVNNIKLLIYKENESILHEIDYEDDNIFLEPLLFTYYNTKKDNRFSKEILKEILQGYFSKKEIILEHSFNEKGVAYIPNLGYYKKGSDRPFQKIQFIKNTTIEVLNHPIKLLNPIFKIASNDKIDSTSSIVSADLFDKNITYLTNAFRFIKGSSPEHFKLIEQCCRKCILFKTNPENTNSFATMNAHGIAFFNVYQEEYDEVFFVDDIAHQTGHIILTTLFFDKKSIYKIDETQEVELILKIKDHRNINILFHALYTYYTTFLCLDNCLRENLFKLNQKKEAIGRIGFYLRKCTNDIEKFRTIIYYFDGIDNMLTDKGINVYQTIENKFIEIKNKWKDTVSIFDYSNQPYNFTYAEFIKNNQKTQ